MNNERTYKQNGVTIRIEAKTRRVIYEYTAGGLGFAFSLFSHIGEPFQASFETLIARHGLQIELYDNANDKHDYGYYERLKG